MRARINSTCAIVVGLLTLPMAGACVPDFAFGDGADPTSSSGEGGNGSGDGDGDGDGGRRRPDGLGGDGGGRRPSTAGGLSTTDASGSGESTSVGSTPTASSGGEGGEGTPAVASSAATTTGGSTGSGGTPGVPCWDGDSEQVVTCSGGESACCADIQYFDYDECGFPGDCGNFAWELACNESADCGGQLCCVTTDGAGGLASIGCSASCGEFEACDPNVGGCSDGKTCSPIPQLQADSHPEYGAFGYCN